MPTVYAASTFPNFPRERLELQTYRILLFSFRENDVNSRQLLIASLKPPACLGSTMECQYVSGIAWLIQIGKRKQWGKCQAPDASYRALFFGFRPNNFLALLALLG